MGGSRSPYTAMKPAAHTDARMERPRKGSTTRFAHGDAGAFFYAVCWRILPSVPALLLMKASSWSTPPPPLRGVLCHTLGALASEMAQRCGSILSAKCLQMALPCMPSARFGIRWRSREGSWKEVCYGTVVWRPPFNLVDYGLSRN
jgi:hypothetical protein